MYPGKYKLAFKKPLQKVNKVEGIPWSVYTGALGLAGQTVYQAFKFFAAEKAQKVSDTTGTFDTLTNFCHLRRAKHCSSVAVQVL